MKVLVPESLPMPDDTAAFPEAAAQAIRYFIKRTGGHAFVLFTSDRFMRDTAGRLAGFFKNQGLRLLVQGQDLSRHALLEEFRREPSSVLFGLDSFWTGVDVPGEALSNVIITRLPFSVPDQPLIRARMDRIRASGGDPFREYALPEAVLKFRQGVGRLIRTASDEGIVVVLDNRILKRWYGRWFFAALPECPVETIPAEDWAD